MITAGRYRISNRYRKPAQYTGVAVHAAVAEYSPGEPPLVGLSLEAEVVYKKE